MKKSSPNIKHFHLEFNLLIIFIVFILSSCNPTKYVPEGETLLNDNHIMINEEGVKKSDLLPYIKQTPNKRIFGTRFYLGLYNLSNINKQKWPHNWLRNIGEEPVVFDSYASIKSKDQIKSYVASKGYFDGQVIDTTFTTNGKTDVFYNINLLPAYTIRNLHYEIADSNIQNLCYFDSVNCLIERGKPYDVDLLQAERSRFERYIRDHGFYGFSGEYISFNVDSTIGNRQVDIYYIVKDFTKIDDFNRITLVPHSMYRVKNVYIYPDFIPKNALEGGEAYLNSMDTINYRGYNFITSNENPEIKYDLIIQSLYLKPGSYFNVTNTEQSKTHLLTLKAYRLVNIFYNDYNRPQNSQSPELLIDCNIQLTLLSQQSFKIELEGTNSAGNLGGALNLIYQHKNLFHGAELFSMKLKGAYEALSQQNSKLRSTQEYGVETSLRLPKFLIPFLEKEGFIKKYNPSTTLLAAYNYQTMPFYTRTMATATFGYNWRAGDYQEHIINPLQLNIVKLPPESIDPTFAARIDSSSYLAYSYKDVMILGGNYSYIFNNQKIQKSRDYWFLRINAEASGNILALAEKLVGAKTDSTGSYNILGQPFAQYVRADFDLRYNFIINDVSSVVYRGFLGIGIPYGNSRAIPFEKQYFGGGANGIRAWQVRSLGPGSYKPDSTFLNQTADIKLEANAEYRFKLFWILEGALFLDAGNIWTYNDDPAQSGSKFILNKFYKDIAVGTGTGLRFDFKFVIGRVDLGMKLRDPAITDGSKWIIMNRPYNFKNDFTMVVGIGYPF
ncbi:MAG TPA: BamA/TamA family outer membrane protein [Bacteroidales bacterium]|nr:BamA/TamA family outer membrane protein [Bacteroidales bacterium]